MAEFEVIVEQMVKERAVVVVNAHTMAAAKFLALDTVSREDYEADWEFYEVVSDLPTVVHVAEGKH